MDREAVANLVAQLPGERLAFLPAKASTGRIAETLVALANTRGGTLILGAGGRGRAQGVARPEEIVARVLDAAQQAEPSLARSISLPVPVDVGGHTLVVVEVPPGLAHAYRLRGRFLGRQGARNVPLSADELRRLLLTRGEVSFESLTVQGATPEDLDADAVRAYAARVERFVGLPPEEVLRWRGCLTSRNEVTFAGLLLFGRHPQQFLPSAQVLIARYPGTEMGDTFLRQVVDGPLPRQIVQAEAFLVDNMRRGAIMRGLVREETLEYPREAVREAIVNAVAHRDYSIRGVEIQVFMFSDRIEVRSPGRLPGHITLENILHERFSRNEIIVQVLSDMGFVERLGYGIDRMVRLMEDAGLPPPRFEETDNGFKLTLYGHGERMMSTGQEGRSRWAHLHVNPRQEQALEYIAEHGRITNREFRRLVPGVSPETLRRDLADLVERGLLLKVGDKRGTYYIFK
ncbi:MAG: helix-turn-helix domain-containing protein [Ardenticatenia bacterium]|nr:helix-turn-helix domain-containing protein [Ardenticatenia bacterium]